MINHPSFSDIPALKTMWKLCFPKDKTQFVNFYFEEVLKTNQSLALWNNNTLVAFLQILPYQIKIGDKTYNAGYISGAMTHPEHRQKGYMQQLLNAAFEEMKKQSFTFSFLIPQDDQLFDFYGKFGYRPAFPKTIKTVSISGNDSSGIVHGSPRNFLSLYPFYCSFLSQQENAVLKTPAQFEAMLEDLHLDSGMVFIVNAGQQGIAFAIPQVDSVLIKELFYDCDATKQRILNAVQKTFQTETLRCVFRHSGEKNHFFGMIKILDNTLFPAGLPDIYMSMMLD